MRFFFHFLIFCFGSSVGDSIHPLSSSVDFLRTLSKPDQGESLLCIFFVRFRNFQVNMWFLKRIDTHHNCPEVSKLCVFFPIFFCKKIKIKKKTEKSRCKLPYVRGLPPVDKEEGCVLYVLYRLAAATQQL